MPRKPVTVSQLSAAITKARAVSQSTMDALAGTQHPQELEILHRCRGEVRAFGEVLDAIQQRSTFGLEH
jgi:hypothetical protein